MRSLTALAPHLLRRLLRAPQGAVNRLHHIPAEAFLNIAVRVVGPGLVFGEVALEAVVGVIEDGGT